MPEQGPPGHNVAYTSNINTMTNSTDALAGALEGKIVVLGSSGVGKTALATRYVHGSYSDDVKSTVGAAFLTKRLSVGDVRIKLQIWDTAGQERFRSIAPMYYRGADAAILVYDLTKTDSLTLLKTWVADLKRNQPGITALFVVGNKADQDSARQVSAAEGLAYAKEIKAEFSEVSAKDNTGIDELFLAIGRTLIRAKRERSKGGVLSLLAGPRTGAGLDSPEDVPNPPPSGSCC